MTSPRERGADLARFYTVTDPRRHPRGYTVYKVTARVVSRRNPEDVQEIIVWKRYSDFKKLHKELWQIHKNLFRHSELFPPFAKGKVFGRFDEGVVEERRQCAEDLLQFSASVPALHGSKQLEEFFKGGVVHEGSELIGPAEACLDSLTDSVAECSTEGCSSDSDLPSLPVDVDSLAELDDGMASSQNSPSRAFGLHLPPDSSAPGPVASDSDQTRAEEGPESRSLFPGSLKSKLGKRDYLEKAGELIKLALKKEEEKDYGAASAFYRRGVDLLLEGVQGESSPTRREAVKRRTAEYLVRAESLSGLRGKPPLDDAAQPPGPLSSRPPWNLRSPAEELKAFRVLGVIDKVLLVMDTRTEQTFILKLNLKLSGKGKKNPSALQFQDCTGSACDSPHCDRPRIGGLRKSSEYSGNRKTIIPRCVPNMVCLHKYIISEESVFLLLQHAEGGKLWSYVSKFLDRSPDGSFALPEAGTPTQRKESPRPPACGAQGGGSLESRASEGGRAPLALPLRASLTPSSQDSVHDEDGHGSSPGWPDSGSGSEDECTTSYLTLCNEYGQEKVGPGSLDEELFIKPRGGEADPSAVGGPRAPLAAAGDSPCRRRRAQGPPGQGAPAALSPSRTSDSLSRSKNSPVELFRIDSKDSTREPLALDFGDRLSGLKAEPLTPLLPLPDSARAHRGPDGGQRGAGLAAQDSISGGSEDSVPVISFEEAAFGGAAGADEGRPDLLVNLPGELEAPRAGADMGPKALSPSQPGLAESKLLEVPDVLGLRLSPEQGQPPVGAVPEGPGDPAWPGAQSVAEKRSGQGPLGAFFVAAVDRGGSGDESPLRALGPELAGTVHSTGDSVDRIAPRLVGTDAWGAGTDALSAEEVLLFTDHADDAAGQEPTLLPRGPRRWGESASALGGDREVHQVFEDLDRKLALSSRVSIPEGCIQRWAAEMVVALDALHREGIVCRDLNPDNILLNDRGHIQLTYFSRWSEVEDSCDTAAVERMYCAPEVGAITEETEACDWWSLGAVLFELLTGKTLVECHPAGINTHTTLNMPECVSEEARSLIQQYNPVERLGAGVAGVEDIKSHPFFTPVDWAELTR